MIESKPISLAMAISDNFSTPIVVLFAVFYTSVFILSTVGNTWVLVTCYKTLKRRHFPFMWLLATLASADLSFTLLTVFTSVGYFHQWVGGNSTCKLQGFLLEASYTASIITLVMISYQRRKALTDPFNARTRSWPYREYTKLVIIWGLSLAVCSPLVRIYFVSTNKNGKLVCVTKAREDTNPKLYYSLHTTFFFAIPLLYIILTQCCIFHTLRKSVVPISNLYMKPIKSTAQEGCKDTPCFNYSVYVMLVSFYDHSNTNLFSNGFYWTCLESVSTVDLSQCRSGSAVIRIFWWKSEVFVAKSPSPQQ